MVVIAFVLDIGSKRIARSNEESKIIQSLIADLTTKQQESRNDVTLLSLEKYLTSKEDNANMERDRSYIKEVAETILRQRIHDDTGFSVESSVPYRILNKYDTAAATLVLAEYSENKRGTSNYLENKGPITAAAVDTIQPIFQSKNITEANIISSFNKKICYIQYNNEQNAEAVRKFQSALKEKTWIAPGIDYVAGDYKNTIKYFNEGDTGLAKRAAAIAKDNFKADFQIVPILSSKYKVPKGQIEVWVNNK